MPFRLWKPRPRGTGAAIPEIISGNAHERTGGRTRRGKDEMEIESEGKRWRLRGMEDDRETGRTDKKEMRLWTHTATWQVNGGAVGRGEACRFCNGSALQGDTDDTVRSGRLFWALSMWM
jgi:hypothetical protein